MAGLNDLKVLFQLKRFYASMIVPSSHTGKPPSNLLFLYSFVHSLHLLLLKLRFLTSVCLLILSQELWKPVVFQAVLYFIFSASWRLFWGKAYRCWFGVKALFRFPACFVVSLLPLLTCQWLSIYYGLHWSFSPLHSHIGCLLIILDSIA